MDNRNLFKKLNNIETKYEECKLNNSEKIILLDLAKKYSKKNPWKKILKIAAVFLLFLGVIDFSTQGSVRAMVSEFVTEIRVPLYKAMGISEESEKYTISLHEQTHIGDFSFIVEDIIIDGKYGYANILYENIEENNLRSLNIKNIKVDNKVVKVISSEGMIDSSNNDIIMETIEFELEKPINKKGDYELKINFEDWEYPDEIATVSFETSSEKLNKDTKVLLENYSIPELEEFIIDSYKIHLVDSKFEISVPHSYGESDVDYHQSLYIIGRDENNNEFLYTDYSGTPAKDSYKVTLSYTTVEPKTDGFNKISLEDLYKYKGEITFTLYLEENFYEEASDDTKTESETGEVTIEESLKNMSEKITKLGEFTVNIK